MRFTTIMALAGAGALAGCGGDDMGGNAGPNLPPSITNASFDVTFPENGMGTVLALSITDDGAQNTVISLSGPDDDDFVLQNGINLAFANPPDFENPADSDGDNVYNVTVTATDSQGLSASADVTVTVTDDATAILFLDPVFGNTATLGNIAVPTASGVQPVGVVGPLGNAIQANPLILIGGTDAASLSSMGQAMASRGYLVATVESARAADLHEVAMSFANGNHDAFGIDRQAIGVTMIGDASSRALLEAAFSGNNIPTFTLASGAPAQDAATHFYSQLIGTRQQ